MTALLRDEIDPMEPRSNVEADLLLDAGQLTVRLRDSLRNGAWVDSFLASCALAQLVADRLHPDPGQLLRAASYLGGIDATWAHRSACTARVAAKAVGHLPQPSRRRLMSADAALSELTVTLAGRVLRSGTTTPHDPRLHELSARVSWLPSALHEKPARLPTCFHAFDLAPSDVAWLADHYLATRPDTAPAVVVGVRTSGSYLAPLLAAALAARGTAAPLVLTVRPERPLNAPERHRVAFATRSGGSVLVIDDPPGAGTALAKSVAALGQAGVPREAITLVLPVFSADGALPASLRDLRAVVKPFPQWAVHERLRPAAIETTLGALLDGAWRIDHVVPVQLPNIGTRRNVRARYRVRFTHLPTGHREIRDVVAEGTGLGYLAGPATATVVALAEHLPRVYGLRDGLLFRDWLPPNQGHPPAGPDAAATIARYVVDRQDRLATRTDPTPQMRGRDPAWEGAAALLARSYGPAAPVAQTLLFGPLTRRLLTTDTPVVLDGATDVGRWLPDPSAGGRLTKVDFHQHSFSHFDLSCYDPVSDLAGAACTPDDPRFARQLRDDYEERTGRHVDPERWLLHRLLHIQRQRRMDELTSLEGGRRSGAAVNAYLAEIFGLDGPCDGGGPLVALDLDGVLETDRFGYPATTPTGALSLRALRSHGYRAVVATGRSLDDARDRCAVFGLTGAVAEYGAVVYTAAGRQVIDLRDAAARDALDQARTRLARHPDVRLDPGHRYAIRARGPGGPLPRPVLELPELAGLRAAHGDGQSDFTLPTLTKGAALAVLASRLGAARIALAVGDTASDLSMLALADLAAAPANADADVQRAGIRTARHAYQAGLGEIVANLLGHRPGGCPTCRPPRQSRRTRAMVAAVTTPANPGDALRSAAALLSSLLCDLG